MEEKEQKAYVTVINGKTVLIDPVAYALMKAINKINCKSTYTNNLERINYFKNRITEKQLDPKTVVIVVINVDAPYGFEVAEALMPGHNWQQYRDKGEIPFARGLAMRSGLIDIVSIFDKDAADKISTIEGMPVIVIDHSVAEIFSV